MMDTLQAVNDAMAVTSCFPRRTDASFQTTHFTSLGARSSTQYKRNQPAGAEPWCVRHACHH